MQTLVVNDFGTDTLQDSKSEGVMLKETTNINSSLFNLGKVCGLVKLLWQPVSTTQLL
jgi:hypothetical protein